MRIGRAVIISVLLGVAACATAPAVKADAQERVVCETTGQLGQLVSAVLAGKQPPPVQSEALRRDLAERASTLAAAAEQTSNAELRAGAQRAATAALAVARESEPPVADFNETPEAIMVGIGEVSAECAALGVRVKLDG